MAGGGLRDLVSHGVSRLLAVVLVAAWALPVGASTIFVREELGFSFVPSGLEWTLEENGPSVTYDLTASFGAGALFDLRYADDAFFMTALADNVAGIDSLPFGIDVYPGGVTPISPLFDCLSNTPCYNGLGFIAMNAFPHVAGESVSLEVPPVAAVAEPATWTLLAAALLSLAWTNARRMQRSS